MNMKLCALVSAAVVVLSGCETATIATTGVMVAGTFAGKSPFHLYPVAGPLADSTTVPVIAGSGSWMYPAGEQTIVFPDGERFTGKLSGPYRGDVDSRELVSAWDSVYGAGYYVANVMGAATWHGKATITGSHGTALQIEAIKDNRDHGVIGVAKDSKGNILKLGA